MSASAASAAGDELKRGLTGSLFRQLATMEGNSASLGGATTIFEEAQVSEADLLAARRIFLEFATFEEDGHETGVDGGKRERERGEKILTLANFVKMAIKYRLCSLAECEAFHYCMGRETGGRVGWEAFSRTCVLADPHTCHVLNSVTGRQRCRDIFHFYDVNRSGALEFHEWCRIVADALQVRDNKPHLPIGDGEEASSSAGVDVDVDVADLMEATREAREASVQLGLEYARKINIKAFRNQDDPHGLPPPSAAMDFDQFNSIVRKEQLRGSAKLFRFYSSIMHTNTATDGNSGTIDTGPPPKPSTTTPPRLTSTLSFESLRQIPSNPSSSSHSALTTHRRDDPPPLPIDTQHETEAVEGTAGDGRQVRVLFPLAELVRHEALGAEEGGVIELASIGEGEGEVNESGLRELPLGLTDEEETAILRIRELMGGDSPAFRHLLGLPPPSGDPLTAPMQLIHTTADGDSTPLPFYIHPPAHLLSHAPLSRQFPQCRRPKSPDHGRQRQPVDAFLSLFPFAGLPAPDVIHEAHKVARRVLSDVFTDTTVFIGRLEKAAWGGGGGGGGEGKGGKRSGVSVCCSMFLCTPAELVGVLGAACKLMEGEEVVKRVSVGAKASSKAVKVIGSIYGQVADLLSMLGPPALLPTPATLTPTITNTNTSSNSSSKPPPSPSLLRDLEQGTCSLVFLGDYAGRGGWGLECLAIVAALKVRFPHSVVLLRGSYDNRAAMHLVAFQDECSRRFPSTTFPSYLTVSDTSHHKIAPTDRSVPDMTFELFDRLSLAAVIDGQILLGSFVSRLPSLYHQQQQHQQQQTSLLSYLATHKKPLRLIVGTGAGVGAGGPPSLFVSLEALFLPQCNNMTEGVAASLAVGRPPVLTQTQMQDNESVFEAFMAREKVSMMMGSGVVSRRGCVVASGGRVLLLCSTVNFCDCVANDGAFLTITRDGSDIIIRPRSFTALPLPTSSQQHSLPPCRPPTPPTAPTSMKRTHTRKTARDKDRMATTKSYRDLRTGATTTTTTTSVTGATSSINSRPPLPPLPPTQISRRLRWPAQIRDVDAYQIYAHAHEHDDENDEMEGREGLAAYGVMPPICAAMRYDVAGREGAIRVVLGLPRAALDEVKPSVHHPTHNKTNEAAFGELAMYLPFPAYHLTPPGISTLPQPHHPPLPPLSISVSPPLPPSTPTKDTSTGASVTRRSSKSSKSTQKGSAHKGSKRESLGTKHHQQHQQPGTARRVPRVADRGRGREAVCEDNSRPAEVHFSPPPPQLRPRRGLSVGPTGSTGMNVIRKATAAADALAAAAAGAQSTRRPVHERGGDKGEKPRAVKQPEPGVASSAAAANAAAGDSTEDSQDVVMRFTMGAGPTDVFRNTQAAWDESGLSLEQWHDARAVHYELMSHQKRHDPHAAHTIHAPPVSMTMTPNRPHQLRPPTGMLSLRGGDGESGERDHHHQQGQQQQQPPVEVEGWSRATFAQWAASVGIPRAELDKWFRIFDKDEDGRVGEGDFLQGLSVTWGQRHDGMIASMFRKLALYRSIGGAAPHGTTVKAVEVARLAEDALRLYHMTTGHQLPRTVGYERVLNELLATPTHRPPPFSHTHTHTQPSRMITYGEFRHALDELTQEHVPFDVLFRLPHHIHIRGRHVPSPPGLICVPPPPPPANLPLSVVFGVGGGRGVGGGGGGGNGVGGGGVNVFQISAAGRMMFKGGP
ncbi:unnamed protein product [Vitrella brassicaformis CCMP3155]|uniref:protein-serine/threonine phosphatase n=4 Tax=Vitrella brassicaformis TaxID=1169539 RepID=A0A0G4FNI5_VITBC|nr:unnamed protein product [Vitrella brassicaformis CCMP3155]|eukprot:CEM15093.1 unnamed protein product [Vitrella brassicaformis CCMP3155]